MADKILCLSCKNCNEGQIIDNKALFKCKKQNNKMVWAKTICKNYKREEQIKNA